MVDLDDAADRHGAYFDEREPAKIFRCKNAYLAFVAEQNLVGGRVVRHEFVEQLSSFAIPNGKRERFRHFERPIVPTVEKYRSQERSPVRRTPALSAYCTARNQLFFFGQVPTGNQKDRRPVGGAYFACEPKMPFLEDLKKTTERPTGRRAASG